MNPNQKVKISIQKYNNEILKLNEEERQLMRRLREINEERTKKQIYIAEMYLAMVEDK